MKVFQKYGLYLVFIFLYAWRPFSLGFYSDDWGTIVGINNVPNYGPFSINLLHYYTSGFLNRPGQIPIFFFFSSIFQNNPILWQFICAISMLISAIALKQLLTKILNSINIKNPLLPNLMACFWLSLPWMLGATTWIVCLPATHSSIFFFLSANFLFDNNWQKSSIFLLISCLLYEAFFFQYFIFFIFILILKTKKLKWKSITISFIFLSISQLIATLWNRFATTGATPVKSFYSNWYQFFIKYCNELPQILLQSTPEFRYQVEKGTKLLLVLFLLSFLIGLLQKKYRSLTIKYIFLVLFSFLGYFISVWIYCITGYGLFSLGPLSRTTLSLSFWLVIIFFFFITHCSIVMPRILKAFTYLTLSIVLISLILSTFLRTMEWGKAWQIQQTILSEAPVEKLMKVEKDATIIYITPNVINEAFIFLAGYDLNNALGNKYPEIRPTPNFCPHINYDSFIYRNTISYDGTNVYYNAGIYSKPSKVYIWDYYNHSFYQIEKPFSLRNREFKP